MTNSEDRLLNDIRVLCEVYISVDRTQQPPFAQRDNKLKVVAAIHAKLDTLTLEIQGKSK